MVIDLLGTNCIGKSTLIATCVATMQDVRHLDLPRLQGSTPGRLEGMVSVARVVSAHPTTVRAFLTLLVSAGWGLASRYWRYFCTQAQMRSSVPPGAIGICDEGVLKKLFEGVHLVDDPGVRREQRAWARTTSRAKSALIESVRTTVDALVILEAEPAEYIRRIHERKFFGGNVSERQILNRYAIQLDQYTTLQHEAARQGMKVFRIDTTDMDSALVRLRQVVRAVAAE